MGIERGDLRAERVSEAAHLVGVRHLMQLNPALAHLGPAALVGDRLQGLAAPLTPGPDVPADHVLFALAGGLALPFGHAGTLHDLKGHAQGHFVI